MVSSSEEGASQGDVETAALIAGETLLSRDDIPDENQRTECFSCGERLTGLFCHKCGQKNDDYRRSIWSLFTETFASIFSLENKMWRTWLSLLIKPGLVAREFSDGKRTRWTSPVRIYLALSIFLFGYMSLTQTRIFSIRTDIVPKAEFSGDVATLDDLSVELVPDFGFFRRQSELDRLNSGIDFDRVTRLMHGTPRQVFVFNKDLTLFGDLPTDVLLKSSQSWPEKGLSENIDHTTATLRQRGLEIYAEKVQDLVETYNNILFLTKDPATISDRLAASQQLDTPLNLLNEVRFSGAEEVLGLSKNTLMSLEQDLEKLGLTRSDLHTLPIETEQGFAFSLGSGSINGVKFSETDLQNLLVQFLRNPALLNEGISRYLPRIMFFTMPFAALIGLVFIRSKRNALLYDHLVHATYIHAITFAFLLTLILLSQWTALTGMIGIFFLGIAIYLPLSAKTMFKRGWFKTIFASYSIAICYGFIMILVVIILTAQSVVSAANITQI